MRCWSDDTYVITIKRAETGWVVGRHSVDSRIEGDLVAGLGDDEALLEFFASQLGFDAPDTSRPVPPNPGPEAPPAASVPPAVSGEAAAPGVDEDAMVMRLEEIREAARPFAALARLRRQDAGYCVVANEFVDKTREYVEITTDDLRRLVRAAGLWTDEMQAPQPQDAPGPAAKPAEADPPPPATSQDATSADDPVVSGFRKTFGGDPAGITTADDTEDPF